MKTIKLNATVTASNEKDAQALRARMRQAGTLLINVMSSPGAGKTTLLSRLIRDLPELKIAVMEADIESDVDAKRIETLGARSIQVHTSGMCHMDAGMTAAAWESLGAADADLIFLENVGNLVCPAEEDVGADLNAVILSVPEGDDKPLKYPLMFRVVDAVLINKIDTRKFFRFDDEAVVRRIHALNPKAEIFFLSAKTGEGVAAWAEYLRGRIQLQKRRPNE